ncbi:hypothetical protein [Sphingobacterium hungaricum]|uniref:Uncharacterized protein n=1 Tax=Sphingobacterium hungaricum TaxID=2082723 RepID=A0A928UWM9_9SPHI|nr:hypothetical protein [Sphingobacterium hungaricum]MBE8712866.1 hypothetical protein [Sphingobacterium hungaricum]
MKKDKLTESEDKYLNGATSLEEERLLKSQNQEPMFKGLNEISKDKMDLDFDEFMGIATTEKEINTLPNKKIAKPIFWKYGAVAMALLVGSLFLINSFQTENADYPEQEKLVAQILKAEPRAELVPDKVIATAEKRQITKAKKQHVAEKEPEILETAQEAYVIVNGKPIYDEAEAERITLSSLKLLASNMSDGKSAMDKMKYISIEL